MLPRIDIGSISTPTKLRFAGDHGWPEDTVVTDSGETRELTREERAAIRKLVVPECANFDREYGCLPLDCECFMLNKWWTGVYCRYFQNAILPLDTALMDALTGGKPMSVETRSCAICGKAFTVVSNRSAYCPECAARERQRRQRDYMRKKRGDVSFWG